jgi:nucleoside-diphosphate-sugar epimerase
MKIVVIGGSGLIGKKLVTRLHERGHERQLLSATQDTRQVVVDTHARYFVAKLDEQSLIPRSNSHMGATRFKGWLSHSTAKT